MATDLIVGSTMLIAIAAMFILTIMAPKNMKIAGLMTIFLGLGIGATGAVSSTNLEALAFTSGAIVILTGIYMIFWGAVKKE